VTNRFFPEIYYNWLSLFGGFIAAVALALILLFFGISMIFEFVANPYLGIVQFLILPVIMFFGLCLIPLGAFRIRRRIRKGKQGELHGWPLIDLNHKSHRNAVGIFAFGSILVILVSAVGSYQAFHYSESVEFCGKTCHEVMKPEYTAYQNSPHARVPCASCHIGPGAGWFVRSKLSGAYQVYAVLANNYPKPIPTPIKNLRPAQETCEQCHWPEKFFGAQEKRFNHYMYDEKNTHWPIDMLMKTGGGDLKTGQAQGIHWHMNTGFKIEYIGRDEKAQDIPWVRATELFTGRVTIYQNQQKPLTEEELANKLPRTMDCMDCHNRPSHIFDSPDHAVDIALLTDKVDKTLPKLKSVAVEAMSGEYATEKEAFHAIATKITEFYQTEYPALYQEKKKVIDDAILALQRSFSQNIFPEMKVRWTEYPGNLGHFASPGCMRCHNDVLASDKGLKITTDCNTCHSILSQGSGDMAEVSSSESGLEFVHPEDIGEEWKETGCFECHDGTQP